MRPTSLPFLALLGGALVLCAWAGPADSACSLLAPAGQPVQITSEKVFLSWDPEKKVEIMAVQPRFEAAGRDLALVVVTPSVPTIEELPADFFHELAVFTTLARRSYPEPNQVWPISKLKDPPRDEDGIKRPAPARILSEGTIGLLKHQTVTADKIDDLYAWLKDNGYAFDQARDVFQGYVEQKWCFTFAKLDPAQLPKAGPVTGAVRPLRFTFASDQLVFPLRINQASAGDYLDVVFTVQAPYKVDLPGELSYQYYWVPLLLNSQGSYPKGLFGDNDLPGKADDWLKTLDKEAQALVRQGQQLGYGFTNKTRPQPNKLGRSATTLEWARRLTAADIQVLKGAAPYTEAVPDPDDGFTVADVSEERRKQAIFKVIAQRQAKLLRERPAGFLIRSASASDQKNLKALVPHLHEGQFVTRLRRVFARDEMKQDVVFQPAGLGKLQDASEYTELLPASPE